MPIARTHAVGKLVLLYNDGPNQHQFSVGLAVGENPFDATSMQGYADDLAGLVRAVLAPEFTITHWKSLDTNLVEALSLPLSAAVDGTHGTDSGYRAFKSLTACITGMTKAPTALNRIQQTRGFLYMLNTLDVEPGEKQFSARGSDAAWDNLVNYLSDHTALWTDKQGRKAAARDSITVQWNSFIQHQLGS